MNAPKTEREERLILDALAWAHDGDTEGDKDLVRAIELVDNLIRAAKDVALERAQPIDFGAVEIIRAHAGDVDLLPGFDRVTGRRGAS